MLSFCTIGKAFANGVMMLNGEVVSTRTGRGGSIRTKYPIIKYHVPPTQSRSRMLFIQTSGEASLAAFRRGLLRDRGFCQRSLSADLSL
jgi:hypothetical protein